MENLLRFSFFGYFYLSFDIATLTQESGMTVEKIFSMFSPSGQSDSPISVDDFLLSIERLLKANPFRLENVSECRL